MLKKILIKIIIFFIFLYQKIFSPNHGFLRFFYPAFLKCRFYPSCSQYFILALKKKGLKTGFFLGVKRILRCNPFSKGGYDPI